jgi:cellulose synthase (UDP-forming)
MVQHYLEALGPALFVAAFFLILVLNWPRRRTWARTVTVLFVLVISLRYLWWRLYSTVLPFPNDDATFYWVWFLFVVEVLAFTEVTLFLLTMSRYVDRSAEADRFASAFAKQPEGDWPTVDVFIPTYDEPIDVLERSIVGALALDYPRHKFKVYVLDDKRRDWLRRYCDEKGAIYVTRPDNLHAKAGNLNNGLKVSSGDLVAVFDADFVPYRHFLRRTVPFFQDPTIGIVQTPQHFFNKDPVQSNLGIERVWPDEQRLFFDEMAASRDAWDVSFCCGSCSVLRRRAIEAIGGIPTESVTEDLLSTLAMLNKGFKTRYLNERLSMGLAAENLRGYFVQRSRWCRGGIQTLFLPNGPVWGPGLSLFQRIMFIPYTWLIQYVVRFAVLIVPSVYLWTGIAPLHFTSNFDIIYYQVPVLLAYALLMRWITPTRYLLILSNAVGVFSTFRLLPTVIATLIKPFGTPFKVTPKGSAAEQNEFDAYTFTWVAALVVLTALGVVINVIPEWSPIPKGNFSVVAMLWAGANIVVLVIAALICFEKPRSMADGFSVDEPAKVQFMGRSHTARLVGLSLKGGIAELGQDVGAAAGDELVIDAAGFPRLTSHVERVRAARDGRVFVAFRHSLDPQAHDRLIVKLYTGDYSNDILQLDTPVIVSRLWQRVFGPTVTNI